MNERRPMPKKGNRGLSTGNPALKPIPQDAEVEEKILYLRKTYYLGQQPIS
jgi:hypothetical protein